MVTLKDFSTYSLINVGTMVYRNSGIDSYGVKFLKEYNIRDFEQLEKMIEAGYWEFRNVHLINALNRARNMRDSINAKQKDVVMYKFLEYINSGYNLDVLNRADEKTSARVLPLNVPVSLTDATTKKLEGYSIADLKELLKRISFNGRNAFIQNVPSFGNCRTLNVVQAIRLFQDQILRVAVSTPDYEMQDNLFLVDYPLKREMILDDRVVIVDEFLMGGSDYIFGPLDEKAQETVRRSVINPHKKSEQIIHDKTIDLIANYTIPQELEKGQTRVRALERFHR
ncbi:MAG: hypothetical protein HFI36_04270 [Bacilli bacterium]|jgi:hypothetical protein|nr:hypothetical protein [Bacilli bacterium]